MERPATLGEALFVPYVRQADYANRLPWSYGERRLLDYLLVCIEQGHCRFTVNRQAYDLKPGDCCLVQPGDLILLEGLTETRTPFAHLDFFYNPMRERSFPTSAGMTRLDSYGHLLQPRLNDYPGIGIPPVFKPASASVFAGKLQRLIGHWREGTVSGMIEVQRMGLELLLELLRSYGPQPGAGGREAPSAMLERVLSYVSLHLEEQVTVKTMADLAHLSPSRFTAVFRERYGTSPYRYLVRLRLDRAAELLRAEPDTPVGLVSEYCGFAGMQHFSAAFKLRFGVSPSAYRQSSLAAEGASMAREAYSPGAAGRFLRYSPGDNPNSLRNTVEK
ncbi:AraC family transcriptional regulator [Paenibacillus cymbidii]|uniref:AraC family transcriptional regulator n=1 Tax=Paenibacillus cymbidii TaxID=1639034 RepID=UPI0010817254|nr:AraC family transcriptional regulator [Paenibacillus cymbidii]